MGVFHVFQFVQKAPNCAKHLIENQLIDSHSKSIDRLANDGNAARR